jgi:iron(III) transport system ATP-binding protein
VNDDDMILRCAAVSKRFETAIALDRFDLALEKGAILGLLGPSGCGKTTALRVMAGFERPDAGEVWVDGRAVAGPGRWIEPEKRRVGMVFQDWALFPHLNVARNVSFGLDGPARERVNEVLEMVHLAGLEDRMPHELSGGQQQRVALARALAPSPDVILLDEPFSNLDPSLRAEIRSDVRSVLHDAKATAIFVTHDREEALSIADRIAIMSRGRVLQTGSPHDVYRSPVDRVVASLIGEANYLSGEVHDGIATTALGRIPANGIQDGRVDVMLRPESIALQYQDDGPVCVVDTEFYGHDQLVRARLDDGTSFEVRLLGPRPDLAIGVRASAVITGEARFFPAA